ncbi:MAG: response regulator transcription factor [Hyphomicrobiales bacterium]
MVDLVAAHGATSVLVDLGPPRDAERLKALARDLPDICLLALSVDDQLAEEVIAYARLGCHGIVPRDATLEDLIRIVRAAERGEVTMRPHVTAKLMQALAANDSAQGMPAGLTRREREICSLVCEGLTNKEIAREVNRSVGTVKNHVGSILSKLELGRRGAISARLRQTGWRKVAGD